MIVSSYNQRELYKVGKVDPAVSTGVLIRGIPLDNAAIGSKFNAYSIHCSVQFIDQELVDDAHNRGMKVFVFTVNYPDQVELMFKLGVNGFFSDYPERVLSYMSKISVDSSDVPNG